MSVFAAAVVLLLALVFALLSRPLWRHGWPAAVGEQEVNLRLARERLAELQADGMSAAKARAEVERGLAVDLLGGRPPSGVPRDLGRTALYLLIPLITLFSLELYLHLGSPAAIGLTGAVAIDSAPDDRVDRLAARLAAKPDDPAGWLMLARSRRTLRQYPQAIAAYRRLRALTGETPAVLVGLADALTLAAKGRVPDEAYALLRQVLAIEPDNIAALWLAGRAARQRGEPVAAVYWRKALALLSDRPVRN